MCSATVVLVIVMTLVMAVEMMDVGVRSGEDIRTLLH
jgi:hypothetical protein